MIEGRKYLTSILENKRLLIRPNPVWGEYEGYFRFELLCRDEESLEKVLEALTEEFREKYTEENFHLSVGGFRSTFSAESPFYLLVKVNCNKTFYEQFDSYNFPPEEVWTSDEAHLITYWTIKQ